MENESTEPARADDAARAEIADDRHALARKVTPTDALLHLAVAFVAAVMVWAPAIGSPMSFTFLMAMCVLALTQLESLRKRMSGGTMSRPGRRGLAIPIGVGVVFVALFAASLALVIAGRAEFALLCAAVTFVAMFVGAWLHDVQTAATRPEGVAAD